LTRTAEIATLVLPLLDVSRGHARWLLIAAGLAWAAASPARALAAGDLPRTPVPARDDRDPRASSLGSATQATDHIYRLAERDRLHEAVEFARTAALRFPDSAPLWEAVGYVRRGSGDYAGALEAYQQACRLDPASRDAIKGQALMLRKLGALAPAAALVSAHPELAGDADLRAILAEQAAQELRYAGSVDAPEQRAGQARLVLAKLDALVDSAGGEIEAAHRGETAPFDRIQANVLLRRDAQAARIYERLVAAGIEVPAYARYQAGCAYARLRQPGHAIAILRRLTEERPDDLDSGLELFYALVDSDQLPAARELIDRLAARAAHSADGNAQVRVTVAAAMARAYDEHPAAAVERLDHVLELAPFNPDARIARATVYFWRGWTRYARDEADAVLAVAPGNADAHALHIQTDIALDDWRAARAQWLHDHSEQVLSERDSLALQRRLSWHDRPEISIQSGYGTGSQASLATNQEWSIDARGFSAPIQDRYRLFAHLRQAHTDLIASTLVRTWGGAGVEATGRAMAASLELAGVSGEPGAAALVRAAWQPADGARLSLQAASSDPDTPARASAHDIRERTVLLSNGYDWNESTGVGLDFGWGHFSDGNRQLNALLRFSQRVMASDLGKLVWNSYAGATRDSLDASRAPYFDPARATSEETELRGEWLGWRDPASRRSRWHVVTASLGRYQQSGFDTRPTMAVRYEQRWSLSDHSELSFGVGRSRHPYDGSEESRTSLFLNYEGRL